MPIHIAITRRVRPGCETEFQKALREFFQVSFAHGGVLGATMIVPPPGSDSRGSAVFNAAMVALLTWAVMPLTTRALQGWLHSNERKTSA